MGDYFKRVGSTKVFEVNTADFWMYLKVQNSSLNILEYLIG